ncbi:hypothetical protein [Prosthecomicrobium pneumaticum]|uniref:Oligosaccharide repeat unit polymerase n=1 Tax=Prosthecomicrobium pneumaticum TaxID=81895 RepID=A0A7W9CU04_9HYPH|nr:hypothetical protein [Prosthecomicrobium pneumaticum]MBB5751867.1 hypothetical protein [Prosthecomicrobium pneumaticum]
MLVIAAGSIAALMSPNSLLVFATGAVLAGSILLLWTPRDVPVLLLPVAMQWLSVAIKPIQTAVFGVELNDLPRIGADLVSAAWFALAGIAALAVGMRLGLGLRPGDVQRRLLAEAQRWQPRRVIGASLAAIAGGHAADMSTAYAGGLGQLFLAFANLRLAGVFVLTFWCVATGRRLGLLSAVVLVETAFGMTGFFSDFKMVVFTFAVAAASAKPKLSLATLSLSAIAAISLICLGVFWNAVKGEYRTFLNAGSGAQVVVQPLDKRIEYMASMISSFDSERFSDGFSALVDRLSYIDFLASTMEYVPQVKPYGNGERLAAAISHILTPRFLFPGKPPLPNDTIVTEQYTGLRFSDTINTSISIGYLGEIYTDFGVFGALPIVGLLGWAMGRSISVLLNYRKIPLILSLSLAAVAVMPALFFERALVKLVGSMLTTFIATLLIQRVLAPRVLRMAFGGRIFRGPRRPALGR